MNSGQHVLIVERQTRVREATVVQCKCGLYYISCYKVHHEKTVDHKNNIIRQGQGAFKGGQLAKGDQRDSENPDRFRSGGGSKRVKLDTPGTGQS